MTTMQPYDFVLWDLGEHVALRTRTPRAREVFALCSNRDVIQLPWADVSNFVTALVRNGYIVEYAGRP